MTISAPANFVPSLPNVTQPSTSQQLNTAQQAKRAAEDDANPDAARVEQLAGHSDLASMQLSQLQALTMSLGQSTSPTASSHDSEAISGVSTESRMDLYA